MGGNYWSINFISTFRCCFGANKSLWLRSLSCYQETLYLRKVRASGHQEALSKYIMFQVFHIKIVPQGSIFGGQVWSPYIINLDYNFQMKYHHHILMPYHLIAIHLWDSNSHFWAAVFHPLSTTNINSWSPASCPFYLL